MIEKAMSGFYYVAVSKGETVACRARGRFRYEQMVPLVGDRVEFSRTEENAGRIERILPRKNYFLRPAVANIDAMVIVASGAIPETDPYLIDRMMTLAVCRGIQVILVINKIDMDPGERLQAIYHQVGLPVICCSAKTGEGIEALSKQVAGKVCAFSGNSGVGKSSILNAMEPGFSLRVGEVSQKLGRGRHTTRHIELFHLENGTVIADTPGFSAFDADQMDVILPDELQYAFPEFRHFLGQCSFRGCAHGKDRGCAVRRAVKDGTIQQSRYDSYLRLYEIAKKREQEQREGKR